MHFIPLKKEPSNYSKYSAFAFCALLYQFFNSNSGSFVEGGRKNISCPRAQGTLATPLCFCNYSWSAPGFRRRKIYAAFLTAFLMLMTTEIISIGFNF